jgi:hypothetical protein
MAGTPIATRHVMKTSFETARAEHDAAIAASQPVRAPLAPLLAGARARGLADGLELMGVAAALLDEQGEVLHVNARALGLMGQALFLNGQRLRARGQEADESLAAAIDSSVRHRIASRVALGDGVAEGVAAVKILPVAADGEEAFQLLRAVAILETPGDRPAPAGASGLN